MVRYPFKKGIDNSNYYMDLNQNAVRKLLLLLGFTSLLFAQSKAQWQQPCEEPIRVNPFFQCQEPFFRPVCGCNYKTYRNECTSYNVYGVNWIFGSGVCQNDVFEFDFYPNPSSEFINFSVEFFDAGNIVVQVIDTYGKLRYYYDQPSVTRFDNIIEVGNFRPGLYLVTVTSGNLYKVKKLIVR